MIVAGKFPAGISRGLTITPGNRSGRNRATKCRWCGIAASLCGSSARFQPVAVKEVKPGVYVFDFGQEFTGWCRLKVDGPAGTHVRLRHAEMVSPDGNIDVGTLMGTLQEEDYILDGKGERTLEPHFTYHGFRYVELSGLPGKLKPDTLVAVNLRTDAAVTGQFKCSNELYNRIQSAAAWTQANLLFDVPNGCAARSERLAWMGDIRPCVQSVLFNFDTAPLLTKYVTDIRDAQTPDGRFTDIAPHAHLSGTTTCVVHRVGRMRAFPCRGNSM